VLTHILFATLERSLEICSGAKDAAFACDDRALEGEGVDELGHHGFGEGIVFSGAVER
jgi:hypothetical protein